MVIRSHKDTIAAIATPPGQGGIGVVRISGPAAKAVLERIWRGVAKVSAFESHRLYYGPVGDFRDIVDRALVAWMKGPQSYTGEDVVEISGHGGQAVMKRLLEACCDAGCRLAEPGEFTKRSFLNGKIDLTQAEAVADVIAASSDKGLKLAQDQLTGRLSSEISAITDSIKELRAFVESSIDFPEEDIEFIEQEGVEEKLKKISSELAKLSSTFDEGRLLREGVRVAITGLPNAGKSTLFNQLIGRDRAIVHHVPGTTRDVVSETVSIDGIAFHLHDTAGLRDSSCEVEQSGVALSREEISKADVVLNVVDAIEASDVKLKGVPTDKMIVVYNKCDVVDLSLRAERSNLDSKNQDCRVDLRSPRNDKGEIKISALTGEGIDKLKRALSKFIDEQNTSDSEGVVVTNARHKETIDSAAKHIEEASSALQDKQYVEFLAEHLRQAHETLGTITGETATDAILEEIFSRFCVGK